MSDVQPLLNEKTPPVATKGTSPWRLVLLLAVFGVALAGLLYDRCVARPDLQRASDTIERLLSDTNADPNGDGTVTEDEVQSELGRKPASVQKLANGQVERYTWPSGLPYRTFDLYVVYVGQQTPLLYAAVINEDPTQQNASPEARSKLPPVTVIPDGIPQGDAAGSRMPSGVGMSAGGAGPKGAGGKGKGRGKKRSDSDGEPAAATPDTPADAPQQAAGQSSSSSSSQDQPAPELPQDDQPQSPPASSQPAAEPQTTPEPASEQESTTDAPKADEAAPDGTQPAPPSDQPPAPQEGSGQ